MRARPDHFTARGSTPTPPIKSATCPRHRSGRPRLRNVRRRRIIAILRAARAHRPSPRSDPRCNDSTPRFVQHRRGHRRTDRARAARGVPDRAHEHRERRHDVGARPSVTVRGSGSSRRHVRRRRGRGCVDECDLAPSPSVGALCSARATRAYGSTFAAVLRNRRVWVNGDEPADGRATRLADGDEVAVLPPVSGGIEH